MTDEAQPKGAKKDAEEPRPIIHLGMMGDGTEEQNLGERGDPAQRIKEDEVEAAFQPACPKEQTLTFDDEPAQVGRGIGLDAEGHLLVF